MSLQRFFFPSFLLPRLNIFHVELSLLMECLSIARLIGAFI